ncbi:unnamed protein product [Dovyalis caffra]|uniref:Small auxin up regulated protein n=1 Tax=Dovyalis caffra TaxID=77055 RepID=A0AAV1SR22_9ROSI|nr:unnamed protein product [Dovyalis caffra]
MVRTNSSIAAADNDHDYDQSDDHLDGNISKELHAVYVGKSRRRYLLSSDVICHPLFQGLIDRSGAGFGDEDNQAVVVACEVVLFEHLLWMLQSGGSQLGSTEELAEFYYTADNYDGDGKSLPE